MIVHAHVAQFVCIQPKIRSNRHLPNVVVLASVVYLLVVTCESWSPEEGERERDALLRFKSSLENADTVLGNWNNPPRLSCPQVGSGSRSPRKPWTGVICSHGYVCGLQLENMKLSGDIDVDALVGLVKLRTLSLSCNQFEGPMPEFRKLGGLKVLHISKNKLSGEIGDDAFKGMYSLKKADMADNEFCGQVPTSLAACPRLTELRIENNQFMGCIPDFPPTLVKFNASNNQLQGPIPPCLQDITDLSAFSGNKGLCGPPLSSKCVGNGSSETKSQINDEIMSVLTITTMIISCLLAIAALFMVYLEGNMEMKKGSSIPGSGGGGGGVMTFLRDDGRRFSLQDLLRASAEVLGSGSFGSAYKAVLMDGHAVVVKKFKQMTNCGREEFHQHMKALGRMSHPHLLPLVAYYYRPQEKLLVFDFVHNGSLARHLHGDRTSEKQGLNWPTRLKIIKGVAKGMAYLHMELPNMLVPHGNLKSSNVLVDKSMEPLLIDYALVPVVNVEHLRNVMAAYKAPEFCKRGGMMSNKSDVWSLGILILETMTGQLPTSELCNWVETIRKEPVFDKEMEATKSAHGQMLNLFNVGIECCEVDVEKRPKLLEVVDKIHRLYDKDD